MSAWEVAVIVISLIAVGLHWTPFLVGWIQRHALPVPAPAPLTTPLLVIVPARNEAARLGPTLDGLLADPSPHLSVVVVDDRSSDGTADLARARALRDPRLWILSLDDEPPPGTFGKPRALQRALDAWPDKADGALVAVIDADVVVQPGLLGALVNEQRRTHAAAVSGLPTLDNVSFFEELLVPAFVATVAITHPPIHVQTGQSAFLNGQILLLDRAILDEVGGFSAVAHTVLEDVALARLLHDNHKRLLLVDVRALARTRMYDGFVDVVRGFGKNARALHGALLVPLALLLLVVPALPWVGVALALQSERGVDDVGAALGVVACAVITMMNRRLIGSKPLYGLLSPLAQSIVAVVFLRAAVIRRGTWRGRTFST